MGKQLVERMAGTKPLRIAFVSSNQDWGGSEHLWSEAAAKLGGGGHQVVAYKNFVDESHPSLRTLRTSGGRLLELSRIPFLPRKLCRIWPLLGRPLSFAYQALRLYISLRLKRRPDLVVLSQGGNHDGWLFGAICIHLRLPFVVICHKASDLYWPHDRWRPRMRAVFEQAVHCFFVSEHTHRLTEEQLGTVVQRASVIRNPFEVAWDRPQDWPGSEQGFRFACVGRLFPKEKGQDLLLRVLARPKWRNRLVHLTFYGSGDQKIALEEMSRRLGLSNVSFAGFTRDVPGIWANHHALLLGSRVEGLPLVIVEAMLSGRVPIVTNVAGNGELIDDGVTGFLAATASEDAIDEAVERAWQRRLEWSEIGLRAATCARSLIPPDPAKVLCDLLVQFATDPARASTDRTQVVPNRDVASDGRAMQPIQYADDKGPVFQRFQA